MIKRALGIANVERCPKLSAIHLCQTLRTRHVPAGSNTFATAIRSIVAFAPVNLALVPEPLEELKSELCVATSCYYAE
eukprot:207017-Pleurochrysis_carterae.AAC.1